MAQDGGTKSGMFHGEMDRYYRESQGWTTRHAIVGPNVTGRTNERIAQSKRVHAGSLAIVDEPQVTRMFTARAFADDAK